eukprot:TRINITY_DN79797_c0_g1_i1.p1 TRINITY_DN79797_c0_g1~~TRINITY_DN79797_c0_g1_i1.p1  ORF type:complete len:479 (-),score=64.10 TRINITY_DN79797_c0_g1_i1:90-1526(-)
MLILLPIIASHSFVQRVGGHRLDFKEAGDLGLQHSVMSLVNFGGYEHKLIGDAAWEIFTSNWRQKLHRTKGHLGTLKQQHRLRSLIEWIMTYADFSALLEQQQQGPKTNLSFGDLTYLTGDFYSSELHRLPIKSQEDADHLLHPTDDDFTQVDPEATVQKIIAEFKKGSNLRLVAYTDDQAKKAKKGKQTDSDIWRNLVQYGLRGDRYRELANKNVNHFGNIAVAEYRGSHALAMRRAFNAGGLVQDLVIPKSHPVGDDANQSLECFQAGHQLLHAFLLEGSAAHFLSDLFSAGHIRVPRSQLDGVCNMTFAKLLLLHVPVGGYLTKMMHDEDGVLGLQVEVEGSRFKTFGDGGYMLEADANNRRQVIKAVLAGITDVFDSFIAGFLGRAFPNKTGSRLHVPIPSPHAHPPLFLFENDRLLGRLSDAAASPAKKPEYVEIARDCSGIEGPCKTCLGMVPVAEAARTKAIGQRRRKASM